MTSEKSKVFSRALDSSIGNSDGEKRSLSLKSKQNYFRQRHAHATTRVLRRAPIARSATKRPPSAPGPPTPPAPRDRPCSKPPKTPARHGRTHAADRSSSSKSHATTQRFARAQTPRALGGGCGAAGSAAHVLESAHVAASAAGSSDRQTIVSRSESTAAEREGDDAAGAARVDVGVRFGYECAASCKQRRRCRHERGEHEPAEPGSSTRLGRG